MNLQNRVLLYQRKDPVKGRAVRGIDIGTKNFLAIRIVRCSVRRKVICTHLAVIDLRGEDGSQTIDAVANVIIQILFSPILRWIWYGEPNEICYITVERQMDHLQQTLANQAAENTSDGSKEKKSKKSYKPPIMYAIYGMLRIIAMAVQNPSIFFNDNAFETLMQPDILTRVTPSQMGNPNLVFVPRSGSQKLGLSGLHGDNRKSGDALDVGIMYMEEEGDYEAAAFMQTLDRPKPLQDANDGYLQARHYLHELEEKDRKAEKQEIAAQKKQEKEKKSSESPSSAKPRKQATKGITLQIDISDEDEPSVNNIAEKKKKKPKRVLKRKHSSDDDEDTDELLPAFKKARKEKE